MNNNVVNFTINLNGNAYDGVINLNNAIGNVVENARFLT